MASILRSFLILLVSYLFIGCGGSSSSAGGGNGSNSNSAPFFTATNNYTISENTTLIANILATDPNNDPISYSLTGGSDLSLFSIDSSSAALSLVNPADFENPLDADSNNIYLVQVTASDASLSTSIDLSITITDVQESSFGLSVRPSNSTCVLPNAPVLSSNIELNRVFTNLSFNRPIALRQSPVNLSRWYVVEQSGVIRTFLSNDVNASVFANLTDRVSTLGNEMGLLGMALHPNFANNNFVYLYYSTSGGVENHQSVISRFTATSATTLDTTSELEIMRFNQPYNNHNGGNILFGPDGFLYIGLGDGGSAGDPENRAQNNLTLLGKMLRINVDTAANGNNYSIPSDNPFVGSSGLDEIFATGLRNPWRWSFDKNTGDIFAGDVGQNQWEEVDIITKGGNYGWRCYEGNNAFNTANCLAQNSYDAPIYEYDHSEGFSITGGYVYRGNAIPSLFGTYLYTDYGSGPIWGISDPTGPNAVNSELINAPFFISSFAEDSDGELYLLDFSNGQIFKIDPASGSGTGTFPNLLSETGCIDNNNPLNMSSGAIPYDINAPFWSDGANKDRWMALADGSEITVEASGDWTFPINSVLIKNFELNGRRIETRLLARHSDGSWGGYSYEWNDQQTDATLVLNGKTAEKENQPYIFPSSSQCQICHTTIAGNTLGPEIRQLNRDFLYPSSGISANQLATLENIGLFTEALPDFPGNLPRITNPSDTNATIRDRARAYLYTNCSQCHQQGGPTNANIDFHIESTDSEMNSCEQSPIYLIGGANSIITPGDAADSTLVLRINCRDGNANCTTGDQMPPLGSAMVDSVGVNIVSSWINSLSSCN